MQPETASHVLETTFKMHENVFHVRTERGILWQADLSWGHRSPGVNGCPSVPHICRAQRISAVAEDMRLMHGSFKPPLTMLLVQQRTMHHDVGSKTLASLLMSSKEPVRCIARRTKISGPIR